MNYTDTSSRHVAMVLRSLGAGGVETHVRQLSAELMRRQCRVSIVGLCEGEVGEEFGRLGVEIIQLSDQLEQSVLALRNIMALRRVLHHLRPDVVHLHGIRPIFIGGLAARLAGVPRIVSTMHGSYRLMAMDAAGHTSSLRLGLSKFLHALGVILSDRFIVVAAFLKGEAEACLRRFLGEWLAGYFSQRISVVVNGIDDRYFQSHDRTGLTNDVLTVGTVARLDPKKGILFLLEAIRALATEGVRCRLLIVGDGAYLLEYKEFARQAKLDAQIIFAGHQQDILPFLRRMDVFVLPSLSEGMPLVILEAMAMGVPVVATAVGGVPEIVREGETGLLVPPADSMAIALALTRLLGSAELRAQLAGVALAYVSHCHRESAMVQCVLEEYMVRP